jgi:hypothetical protein
MAIFELTSTIISVDCSALGLRIDQASAHDDLILSDLACMGLLEDCRITYIVRLKKHESYLVRPLTRI